MSKHNFLPATFSPVNANIENNVAIVNFGDFLKWVKQEYGVTIFTSFNVDENHFDYESGLSAFESNYCYFFGIDRFAYFRAYFMEVAEMPICYADEFSRDSCAYRRWLIDVYTGDIRLFFDISQEPDARRIGRYGRDVFYIRGSSVVYDDFNRREDFIYNLKTVYDEDGDAYFVPKKYDEDYFVCENCGKLIFSENDEHVITDDGSVFCSSVCANDCEYTQCDRCGKWTSISDATYVENVGMTYCDECVEELCYTCSHCGTVYDSREATDDVTTEDGDHFCSAECAELEDYTRCDECGYWYPIDSLHYSDYSERYLCDDCYSEDGDIPNVIRDYGYKPNYRFNATPEEKGQKNLYFGMEIETEFDDRDAFAEALTCLDRISSTSNEQIYLKHDGSLSNYGVEIVTMPCTLDFVKSEDGAKVFKDVFRELDFASPSSDAGTHVHISRAGFTEEMCICLELFFMRAADLCQMICGRGSVHYARYDMGRDVDNLEEFKPCNCDYRYRCINWNNSRTVEIRAFAAITTIAEYYKNIEFCHAVYQYVKAGEVEFFQHGDVKNDFVSYVERNKERYSYLYDFISENIND